MKLTILVDFDHELSPRCQADVKRLVQELKGDLEACGGTIKQADLVTGMSGDKRWGDKRETSES